MEIYRQRIDGRSKTEDEEIERALRLATPRAERGQIFKMVRSRTIPEETAQKIVRDINLTEARLTAAT